MIDDLLRVSALLSGLEGALPVHATPTDELAAVMRKQWPGRELPRRWRVTEITYAGDPGGIMCRLAAGEGAADSPFVVSITHLNFDARTPMAREIAAYQKRRTKWLRKSGDAKPPLQEDGPSRR